MPRVRKNDVLYYSPEEDNGAVAYYPKTVKLDSPRFRASMTLHGVEMYQLEGQPEHGPYGSKVGSGGPLVARKRKDAWEKLRAKNLNIVLRARDAMVEQEARDKEARLKAAAAGFGQVSIAAQLEEQRSAMIAMAEAQAKATGEAMQRRIADVQKQVEEEKSLADARVKKQREIMIELERRKEEQRKKTAAQIKQAQQAQLERERLKAERYEKQQAEKASKLYKYAEADKVREAEAAKRRSELRQRSLAFARKHQRKIARIQAARVVKEEERVIMGEETAVKMEESEKVRIERVAARKEQVMAENRERSRQAEIRLQSHIEQLARQEEELKVAAEKKEVEVTERVAANKMRIAEETEEARAEERKKAEVIAQKLLMGEAHRKEKAKLLVRGLDKFGLIYPLESRLACLLSRREVCSQVATRGGTPQCWVVVPFHLLLALILHCFNVLDHRRLQLRQRTQSLLRFRNAERQDMSCGQRIADSNLQRSEILWTGKSGLRKQRGESAPRSPGSCTH